MLELSAASASIAQKGKGGTYGAEYYRFESCWGLWDVTGALQSQAAANEVIKPSSSANGHRVGPRNYAADRSRTRRGETTKKLVAQRAASPTRNHSVRRH